jgi:6-pyruvoyltetrahydropterin/6-carboxytetrahydropterin synthase
MDAKIFREYRLKFYLNARHYIIIKDNRSDTHPHTWEFALTILVRRKEFVEFKTFEQKINAFLEVYQDRILNELAPFDSILPTLENMVDYFTKKFVPLIREVGGELLCVEGSEGPSRTYIVDLRDQDESIDSTEHQSEKILSDIIDSVLDDIID